MSFKTLGLKSNYNIGPSVVDHYQCTGLRSSQWTVIFAEIQCQSLQNFMVIKVQFPNLLLRISFVFKRWNKHVKFLSKLSGTGLIRWNYVLSMLEDSCVLDCHSVQQTGVSYAPCQMMYSLFGMWVNWTENMP